MATINLELFKGKKLKDGRHPITVRVYHLKDKNYISTGISAYPKEWDETQEMVNKTYKYNNMLSAPKFDQVKVSLMERLTDAKNIMLEFEKKKKQYTLEELTNTIKRIEKRSSFFEVAKQIEDENRNAKKIGNATAYKTIQSVVRTYLFRDEIESELKNYGEKEKKPSHIEIINSIIEKGKKSKDLYFDQINYSWLKNFETWHLSKGGGIGGLNTYMRTIRAVFNRAINNMDVLNYLYSFGTGKGKYTILEGTTRKKAISKDSVSKIKNLCFKEHSQEWHAQKFFLWSFYSRGQDFVDMAYIKVGTIIDGQITYTRKKTIRKKAKTLSLKVTPQMEEIYKLYAAGKGPDEFLFPIIERTDDLELERLDLYNRRKTYNKYLRRIGEMAGINTENFTSKSSRHTWATVAKKSGVGIAIISQGLGHSKQATTEIYLDDLENEDVDFANELITSL